MLRGLMPALVAMLIAWFIAMRRRKALKGYDKEGNAELIRFMNVNEIENNSKSVSALYFCKVLLGDEPEPKQMNIRITLPKDADPMQLVGSTIRVRYTAKTNNVMPVDEWASELERLS